MNDSNFNKFTIVLILLLMLIPFCKHKDGPIDRQGKCYNQNKAYYKFYVNSETDEDLYFDVIDPTGLKHYKNLQGNFNAKEIDCSVYDYLLYKLNKRKNI